MEQNQTQDNAAPKQQVYNNYKNPYHNAHVKEVYETTYRMKEENRSAKEVVQKLREMGLQDAEIKIVLAKVNRALETRKDVEADHRHKHGSFAWWNNYFFGGGITIFVTLVVYLIVRFFIFKS